MSTVIAKNVQVGSDGTPSNNFTIYQPSTPDGTLRIGNGNTGTTSSLVTLNSAGAATVNALTVSGATALSTLAVNSNNISAVNSLGFRNRIINGGMVIDQRNNGAAVTGNASVFSVDRWICNVSQSSKFTVQRNAGSVTPPAGFTNYLGVTSSSAYTVLSGDYFAVGQAIEGFNTADLGYGAAGAQTVAVSFWVRSSLTGTFSFALTNSAYSRGYVTTYTVNSANTWEFKTVTIPGDTTGTWLTNNEAGIRLFFNLGAGSTQNATPNTWGSWSGWGVSGAQSVVGTNGATLYITGVQLEAGSVATPFERRPYGTELQLCQRYCHSFASANLGRARDGDTVYGGGIYLGTTMRAQPTLRSGASFAVSTGSAGTPQIYSVSGTANSPDCVYVNNSAINWTANALIAFTGIFEAEL